MLHDKKNAAYLVGCAIDLLDQCRCKWEERAHCVNWPRLADLCYWRFCRFASNLAATLVEMGAPAEETQRMADTFEMFVTLTNDMLEVAHGSPKNQRDSSAIELIQRANLHCNERAEWLQQNALKAIATENEMVRLSHLLAKCS